MSRRIEKVNELLRQEVSRLLHDEVDLNDIWVTVVGADTSSDLSQSKIMITVFPTEKSEEALKIIQKNVGQLQKKLNRRLEMRWIPRLLFKIDQGEVKAQNLEETLKE